MSMSRRPDRRISAVATSRILTCSPISRTITSPSVPMEAASIGTDGEVMVLEMGEQVKILDVATALVGLSGRRDIDIVYTGLRPGEKIGEDLFSADEDRRATSNPLINSVGVPTLNIDEVLCAELDNHKAAAVWM